MSLRLPLAQSQTSDGISVVASKTRVVKNPDIVAFLDVIEENSGRTASKAAANVFAGLALTPPAFAFWFPTVCSSEEVFGPIEKLTQISSALRKAKHSLPSKLATTQLSEFFSSGLKKESFFFLRKDIFRVAFFVQQDFLLYCYSWRCVVSDHQQRFALPPLRLQSFLKPELLSLLLQDQKARSDLLKYRVLYIS